MQPKQGRIFADTNETQRTTSTTGSEQISVGITPKMAIEALAYISGNCRELGSTISHPATVY